MVDAGDADETHGQVWSTALYWSGKLAITLQRTTDNAVGLTGGAGHEGLTARLAPGATRTTPRIAGALLRRAASVPTSRSWHAICAPMRFPHPTETRPSSTTPGRPPPSRSPWRPAPGSRPTPPALGAELFVNGRRLVRRPSATTGPGSATGTTYAGAFPDGLQPLSNSVHELGLKFGLWVEPEMVNPDSALYRAHPDWVLTSQPRAAPSCGTSWCELRPGRGADGLRLAHPAVATRHRLPKWE